MADVIITKQELIDAQKDAKTLEDVINGTADTQVTARLGRTFWTLATLNSKINSVETAATQGLININNDVASVEAARVAAESQMNAKVASVEQIFDNKLSEWDGEAQTEINEWRSAIALITQEDGIPALAVSDASGKTQQEINNGVGTIADLIAVENPYQGARIYVKGYHAPTNYALAQPYLGGGEFVYNSAKSSVNDGICCFNGWERQGVIDFVTPEMAGAKRDNVTDDSDAFDIATHYAWANQISTVLLSAGSYKISRPIQAYAGLSYYRNGLEVRGQGKGATYIYVDDGVNGIEILRGAGGDTGQITNVKLREFTIHSNTYQVGVGIHSTTNISGVILDEINFINWGHAVKFDGTFYICSLTGLFASSCKNGYDTGFGGSTTLFIDRCYVQSGGSTTDETPPVAFKLGGGYSTVGSLACDNYAGTAYHFYYGGFSVNSLGCERSGTNINPNGAVFRFEQTNTSINNIYLLNTKGLTDDNTILQVVVAKVNIEMIRVAKGNGDTDDCPARFSSVYSDGSSSIEAKLHIRQTRLDVNFATSPTASSAMASHIIDSTKYLYGRTRPFIGLYDRQVELDKMFGASNNMAKTSLWFDIYGASFRYSGYDGSVDAQWQVAPLLGDWGIQRRPDVHGIAAVVNLKEGASNVNALLSSDQSIVPLINRKLPTSPEYGAFHLNTTSKVMNTWDGSAWMEVASPTIRYSATYNPPSIEANSVFKYELALTGVTPSHFVQVAFSIENSDVEITARAGTDKVYIYFKNLSAAAIDLASGTLKVLAKL